MFHVKQCSWKTTRIRFGRIASLSAFVLFAGGCVVRIAYESFLDYNLQEFFMFLEWRTANCLFLLDFYYCSLSTLCRGQLAPCTPRRAEPARPQLPAARFFRLFPKNTTPFPRNSTKKFDSRKKTCYNEDNQKESRMTHERKGTS